MDIGDEVLVHAKVVEIEKGGGRVKVSLDNGVTCWFLPHTILHLMPIRDCKVMDEAVPIT